MRISRRSALLSLAASSAALALRPASAEASLALSVSLAELVQRSHRIVFATPMDSFSRWETIASGRRIVTYSTVRVDEPLDDDASATEHVVRTLGGAVGDVGQLVHGEASLRNGERTLLFLRDATDGDLGLRLVTARAQGQFALRADLRGVVRLHAVIHRSELIERGVTAAQALGSRSVSEGRTLVLNALSRSR